MFVSSLIAPSRFFLGEMREIKINFSGDPLVWASRLRLAAGVEILMAIRMLAENHVEFPARTPEVGLNTLQRNRDVIAGNEEGGRLLGAGAKQHDRQQHQKASHARPHATDSPARNGTSTSSSRYASFAATGHGFLTSVIRSALRGRT